MEGFLKDISEERVTIDVLQWLSSLGWEIICYDFPQSGTGRVLHPFGQKSKNEESIIPDIIALKGNNVVYFENKSAFVLSDLNKLNHIKTTSIYKEAFERLVGKDKNIYYGVAFPVSEQIKTIIDKHAKLIDFIVNWECGKCLVTYDPNNLFQGI